MNYLLSDTQYTWSTFENISGQPRAIVNLNVLLDTRVRHFQKGVSPWAWSSHSGPPQPPHPPCPHVSVNKVNSVNQVNSVNHVSSVNHVTSVKKVHSDNSVNSVNSVTVSTVSTVSIILLDPCVRQSIRKYSWTPACDSNLNILLDTHVQQSIRKYSWTPACDSKFEHTPGHPRATVN